MSELKKENTSEKLPLFEMCGRPPGEVELQVE